MDRRSLSPEHFSCAEFAKGVHSHPLRVNGVHTDTMRRASATFLRGRFPQQSPRGEVLLLQIHYGNWICIFFTQIKHFQRATRVCNPIALTQMYFPKWLLLAEPTLHSCIFFSFVQNAPLGYALFTFSKEDAHTTPECICVCECIHFGMRFAFHFTCPTSCHAHTNTQSVCRFSWPFLLERSVNHPLSSFVYTANI